MLLTYLEQVNKYNIRYVFDISLLTINILYNLNNLYYKNKNLFNFDFLYNKHICFNFL